MVSLLTTLSIGLLAIAAIWAVVVMARTSWLWIFGLIFILPFFLFLYRHPGQLKIPGLILAASLILSFAALIADGDLFENHHPDEPRRSFRQRALGCSGSAVWKELIAVQETSLEDWLPQITFEAGSGETEIGAAAMAAFASALAYVPAERFGAMASFNSFQRRALISDEPYQAAVVGNDRLIIVAFRGTDNARNWMHNFRAIPAAFELGMVHAGFLDGYNALSAAVIKQVLLFRDNNQAVWAAGHSLGGAIAVLAAPELQRKTERLERVITFGQPPVGYSAFAQSWQAKFPDRLVRYVNHRDAVAAIVGPIALPWTELQHVGGIRYFDTTGKLHVNGVPYIQLLRDAVCAPTMEAGAEFNAHFVRRYLKLVLNAS